MFELRIPCLDSQQRPMPNQQVVVYLADGVTAPELFDLQNQPLYHILQTDNSGLIQFRLDTEVILTFRPRYGQTLGNLYPLYDPTNPVVPEDPHVSEIFELFAGEVIQASRGLKILNTGDLAHASAEDAADYGNLVGIARQTGAAGQPVEFASSGYYTDTGLTLTPGKPVFLGANGSLIQAPLPGTLSFIQSVGVAVTANTLRITLSPAILR